MKTVDRPELDRWTQQQRAFALINVLPASAHADFPAFAALPAGSPRDFESQIASLSADKSQTVVLYESGTASVPASTAAGMLEHAGFENVYHFVGPQAALHEGGHASHSR